MEESAPSVDSAYATHLRQMLADELKRDGHLHSSSVEAAFRGVPRHLFLPALSLEDAYRNKHIPIKIQDNVVLSTASEPTIMAIMLEQLRLEPGQRVLEIGAGSGYNAALMAHIVGEAGEVVTVDIDEDLVEDARVHLAVAGFERVRVICGDGGLGYPAAAPYDRVILTVRAWDIAPAWQEQLKAGGLLLLPLEILPQALRGPQVSAAFEKVADCLRSLSVRTCYFLRLRGAFAGPDVHIPLGPDPGLWLAIDEHSPVDAEVLYRSLTGPYYDLPIGLELTHREIWKCCLWLSLQERDFCSLVAEGALADPCVFPPLSIFPGKSCSTFGLLEDSRLCLLASPPEHIYMSGQSTDGRAFEPFIRSFDLDGILARHFVDLIVAWDAVDRPPSRPFPEGLQIRAYPLESSYVPAEHEIAIPKRWHLFVLDWQGV